MNFKINQKLIGGKSVYVIAEIGNNHNGCFDRAIELVDAANRAGADCAKFQMRTLTEVYRSSSLKKTGEDLGSEYIIDLLTKFELTPEQHERLKNYCESKGLEYLCTPWDLQSLKQLENLSVSAYKLASADLTNVKLIEAIARTNKPIIVSTGMSTLDEIKMTSSLLSKHRVDYALLHCNSTYPAPIHDINLRLMNRLKEIHPLIGYSGHERGTNVTLGAVALGAKIVERHLTLDRLMEGPDHAASLTADEFSQLVLGIREIEEALGDGKDRIISQGEMINRENLAKSLVAARPIQIGEVICASDIAIKSPGKGLSPQHLNQLIGQRTKRAINADDFFFYTDISGERARAELYNFTRPWGIPVRHHDFKVFHKLVVPKLWEIHLSYSDMNLELESYFLPNQPTQLVVHAPELFENSHLLDLASPDTSYRENSIRELQRVIDLTRRLNSYFPDTNQPLIVTNVGGFTMDSPLDKSDKDLYYERLGESLKKLDTADVEIIPQTMAPYPWHFGGQRYQNLFVISEEIITQCDNLGCRICFDVSHSALHCNHSGNDFLAFAEKIAPYTAHIHIGDAKGLNGEGLQIGDGTIEFTPLLDLLDRLCPEASFIPEIWQGHKNEGEDFWIALKKLESYWISLNSTRYQNQEQSSPQPGVDG